MCAEPHAAAWSIYLHPRRPPPRPPPRGPGAREATAKGEGYVGRIRKDISRDDGKVGTHPLSDAGFV